MPRTTSFARDYLPAPAKVLMQNHAFSVPCHTHYGKQHWADLRNPAAEHPCTALPPWAAAVARLWSAAQEQMPPYQLPNP